MNQVPQLLGVEELARTLGLTCKRGKRHGLPSTKAVYNMLYRGQIPPDAVVRIGSRLLFRVDRISAWIERLRGVGPTGGT